MQSDRGERVQDPPSFLVTAPPGNALQVQHATSMAAHTFNCVSPRLSHSIWFLDYAGIALNFVRQKTPLAVGETVILLALSLSF